MTDRVGINHDGEGNSITKPALESAARGKTRKNPRTGADQREGNKCEEFRGEAKKKRIIFLCLQS